MKCVPKNFIVVSCMLISAVLGGTSFMYSTYASSNGGLVLTASPSSGSTIDIFVHNTSSKSINNVRIHITPFDMNIYRYILDPTLDYTCTSEGDGIYCNRNSAIGGKVLEVLVFHFSPSSSLTCPTGNKTYHSNPGSRSWNVFGYPAGMVKINFSVTCISPCGNGSLDSGEACDLGSNNGKGKGCTSTCSVQSKWKCTNNVCTKK